MNDTPRNSNGFPKGPSTRLLGFRYPKALSKSLVLGPLEFLGEIFKGLKRWDEGRRGIGNKPHIVEEILNTKDP